MSFPPVGMYRHYPIQMSSLSPEGKGDGGGYRTHGGWGNIRAPGFLVIASARPIRGMQNATRRRPHMATVIGHEGDLLWMVAVLLVLALGLGVALLAATRSEAVPQGRRNR
jgi:hypothetical protein